MSLFQRRQGGDEVAESNHVSDRHHLKALAEMEALAPDVRKARAYLAVPEEVRERVERAFVELQASDADLGERWVEAHEDLSMLRRQAQQS